MEDKTIKKLNIPAADLPEVPRTEDGKIDIDKIAIGKNEKDNYIVPDEIIEKYFKELPDGTTNPNNDKWVYSKGILRQATKEVQKMGAEALNAKVAQRKSFAEAIDGILTKKANKEAIEDLELKEDATNLDMIIAAALKQAARGNAKAWEFLRDTVGEKPTEKIAAEVETITPEDRRQIERILNRDKTQDIVKE
jgi:hypothetical protein